MFKRLTNLAAICILAITANALDLPTQTINGVKYQYYTVKKGDTLYSVSHQLGIGRDEIVAQNPWAADAIKAGQTLYFACGQQDAENGQQNAAAEPIEPIVEQPHTPTPVDKEVIHVGIQHDTPAIPDSTSAESEDKQNQPAISKTREIAIFMPFMLDENRPGKTAEGATEFYRGFLLGIDTLASYGIAGDIKVSVYDTANKMLTLKKALANNESLKTVDLIITPDNAEQTELLGKWGKKYDIPVLNLFVARDTAYLSNPQALNANIPTAEMLTMAAKKYEELTRGYKPVILKHKGAIGDKKQFVEMMEKCWRASGMSPITLEYSDRVTEQWLSEQLATQPENTRYVFISPSASYSDFSKYAMALPSFADKIGAGGGSIMLLGYPEWTTFKSDALKTLHEDNTVIYSRFFNDVSSFDVQNVDNSFAKWYGQGIAEGVPSLGLLGYDAAQFAIKMLSGNSKVPPMHDGLQTRFSFNHGDGTASGYVNNALQIVRFLPGGIIENIAL